MKKGRRAKKHTHNHTILIVGLAAALTAVGYFLVPGLANAVKNGMGGGGGTTPLPGVGEPHSMDLERDLGQFLSITDMAQSGLDLTGDLTFEAWVKLESAGPFNTNHNIFNKGNARDKVSYSFYWRSNDPNVRAQDDINVFLSPDGTTQTIGPQTADYQLRTGEWTHLAAAFDVDEGKLNIYVNGQPRIVEGSHFIPPVFANNHPFVIGSRAGAFDFLDGKMDEVRIWNVTRTQEEIVADSTHELSGAEPGLAGYWKFNSELVDGKMRDSSLLGNHLKLNNKPQFSGDVPF